MSCITQTDIIGRAFDSHTHTCQLLQFTATTFAHSFALMFSCMPCTHVHVFVSFSLSLSCVICTDSHGYAFLPLYASNESLNVVFPWSTCATIHTFLVYVALACVFIFLFLCFFVFFSFFSLSQSVIQSVTVSLVWIPSPLCFASAA